MIWFYTTRRKEPESFSPLPVSLNVDQIGKFNPTDPETSPVRKVAEEWSKGMRETKICVFDSSMERKTIRKFNEAFLSGCVVASDIPSEMEYIFRGVVIELDARMTEQEIDLKLRGALQDPVQLQQMAVEAMYRARNIFNCKSKVDKLLEAVARYQIGERGYWFPDGFSATCRSYANDKKFKEYNYPPWCVKDSKYEGFQPTEED